MRSLFSVLILMIATLRITFAGAVWPAHVGDAEVLHMAVSADGSIYTGQLGFLYKFDADGALRWKVSIASGALAGIAEDGHNNIYVTTMSGHVYAISVDGAIRWHASDEVGGCTAPSLANDVLAYGNDRGVLTVRTAGGDLKWRILSNGIFYTAPIVLGDGSVAAFVNNTVIPVLHCYSGDGRELWSYKCESGYSKHKLISSGDSSITCAVGKEVYRIDASGNNVWRASAPGEILQPPVADNEGCLYVLLRSGEIWKLSAKGEALGVIASIPAGSESKLLMSSYGIVGIAARGEIYLMRTSGEVINKTALQLPIVSAAFSEVNGMLYCGTARGDIHAVSFR